MCLFCTSTVSLTVKKQECQRLCFWIGIRSVVLGHTPSNQADLQNFDTCNMTSMFVSGDMAIQMKKKKKKRFGNSHLAEMSSELCRCTCCHSGCAKQEAESFVNGSKSLSVCVWTHYSPRLSMTRSKLYNSWPELFSNITHEDIFLWEDLVSRSLMKLSAICLSVDLRVRPTCS